MKCLKFNIVVLITSLLCFHTYAQVCEDSVQAFGLYGPDKINHIGSSFLQMNNGNIANIGRVQAAAGARQAIILTNAQGRLLAAKLLDITDPQYYLTIDNLIEAPGNEIIAYGRLATQTGHEKGVVVIRFTSQLNIVWSRLLQHDLTEPEQATYVLWGLHCDEQGNIFFSFHTPYGNPLVTPNVFFVRLDAQGNIQWSNGMDYRALTGIDFSLNGITTIDNKVLFLGNCQAGNYPGIIGFSFDRTSGQLLRVSRNSLQNTGAVENASPHFQNLRLFPGTKDCYYTFGELGLGAQQSNLIHLLVDTALNASQSKRIKGSIWSLSSYQFSMAQNGALAFVGKNNYTANHTSHFGVVDSAGRMLIGKQIGNNLFPVPILQPAILDVAGKHISLSVANGPVMDSLTRVNIPLDGDTALYHCLGKDTSFFSVEPVTMQKADLPLSSMYTNVTEARGLTVLTTDFLLQKQEFCKVKSTCSVIEVTGTTSFCTQTRQTFIARKNAGCLKGITWNIHRIPAAVVLNTDSSITLEFQQAWSGYVAAYLNGCLLADSVYVEVAQPLTTFNLGNDKVLCPGDSLVLSAPPGYTSYSWSTEEATPAITVKQAGAYTVKTTDHCGNTFSDVIKINDPDNALDYIESASICKDDSVIIPRLPWVTQYTWQPAGQLINGNSFVVKPSKNTSYYLQAEDQYGCISSSSFTITVRDCPEFIRYPSAFTPNQDGKNDRFGPVLEGRWTSFAFMVYNRWGQVVFSSTDPSQKWDGKVKGRDAPTGIYIWVCRYQLYKGIPATDKGTVVLLR